MLSIDDRPSGDFQQPLASALAGHDLLPQDGYRLIGATGSDLSALMLTAALVRDRHKGRTATYSRKVFIPLTNLCRQKCGYCTFSKAPDDPLAHTMTPDEVLTVAEAGRRQGCKEAMFSLGERPEEVCPQVREQLAHLGHRTMISYLRAMCELVLEQTGLLPHANPGILTREELAELREVNVSMGLMLENVSARLAAPGGPHWQCAGKLPAARLDTIAYAGEMRVPFTTGLLIGIGETPKERVDSLLAIKELHARHGHIQEVIIQNLRVKEDTAMRGWQEPSMLDMARTIAVARLLLPAMNIQAPPNLTPEAYQFYLLAGINDWGGVSPVTSDFINPEAPWPSIAELKAATEKAGFELRERLAIYPEYLTRRNGFLRQPFRQRVLAWTDHDGYVRREEERC
ncbi:MAG: 7,8-didemethyl-8-hydroxy-5-deazariboflavin synthase CofG [Dehalococcoidia bacterium]|nr:MAG: 7,8-didemethyl-8-hydroxy-5-deazariboflavin synthase CofG [Dehalococcoidia bacterium]